MLDYEAALVKYENFLKEQESQREEKILREAEEIKKRRNKK